MEVLRFAIMLNDSSDFYTSLVDAKEEIWHRWRNDALRKKVAAYIGVIPHLFQESPRAVLDRNIATPNLEFIHFKKVANNTSLSPLVTEYVRDKFVTINRDKRALGKMPFYKGRDKRGRIILKYRRVIDCTKNQGKPMDEIKTLWDEALDDFHHRLLVKSSSGEVSLLDVSVWYKSNGGNAKSYYHKYLAFFICHGILFENFITNEEEEERFSRSIVYPAFKQVVNHFGMKPLIVPLVPHDQASDIYWRCYRTDIEEEVLRHLCQCEAKKYSEHHDEARRSVRRGHNG